MDDNYEIINGKKYKKCKENQIRNPITRRCVYIDKKTAKNILNSEGPRYILKYVKKREVKKKINFIENRINIYKKINSNIGDKIILGGNIILGNNVNYGNGNIYISNLKKIPKYLFASRIDINSKIVENEINYFKILTDAVLNNRCIHFPLLYGQTDIVLKKDELNLLPKMMKIENNKMYKILFMELADGNLRNFINDMSKTDIIYLNALSQIFMSIMFFYKETNCFHNNSIWEKFTYIKVEKGGYFHYEIMGNNYYIENLGYVWMICDYDKSIDFTKSIEKYITLKIDFEKIIYSFLPLKYNGKIKEDRYKMSKISTDKILKILFEVKNYVDHYSHIGMNIFLNKILKSLVKNEFIKTSINHSMVINKIPYKINSNQL